MFLLPALSVVCFRPSGQMRRRSTLPGPFEMLASEPEVGIVSTPLSLIFSPTEFPLRPLPPLQTTLYFPRTQTDKTKSSWESCVKPATAFETCDSDNQPCACSAYCTPFGKSMSFSTSPSPTTFLHPSHSNPSRCDSKYCPGDYPHTSELEGVCLHPVELITDLVR